MVAISRLMHSLFASAAYSTVAHHMGALQGFVRCDVTNDVAHLNLAPINNSLTPPTNIRPTLIGLAFGVQNYTCTQSNNFT